MQSTYHGVGPVDAGPDKILGATEALLAGRRHVIERDLVPAVNVNRSL